MGRWRVNLTAGITEYNCSAKVEELGDVLLRRDAVVKFEIPARVPFRGGTLPRLKSGERRSFDSRKCSLGERVEFRL